MKSVCIIVLLSHMVSMFVIASVSPSGPPHMTQENHAPDSQFHFRHLVSDSRCTVEEAGPDRVDNVGSSMPFDVSIRVKQPVLNVIYGEDTSTQDVFTVNHWEMGSCTEVADGQAALEMMLLPFVRQLGHLSLDKNLCLIGYSDGFPYAGLQESEQRHIGLGECRAEVVKAVLVSAYGFKGHVIRIYGLHDQKKDLEGTYRRVELRLVNIGESCPDLSQVQADPGGQDIKTENRISENKTDSLPVLEIRKK